LDLSTFYFEFNDPQQTVAPPGFGTYLISFMLVTLAAFSLAIPFY